MVNKCPLEMMLLTVVTFQCRWKLVTLLRGVEYISCFRNPHFKGMSLCMNGEDRGGKDKKTYFTNSIHPKTKTTTANS